MYILNAKRLTVIWSGSSLSIFWMSTRLSRSTYNSTIGVTISFVGNLACRPGELNPVTSPSYIWNVARAWSETNAPRTLRTWRRRGGRTRWSLEDTRYSGCLCWKGSTKYVLMPLAEMGGIGWLTRSPHNRYQRWAVFDVWFWNQVMYWRSVRDNRKCQSIALMLIAWCYMPKGCGKNKATTSRDFIEL